MSVEVFPKAIVENLDRVEIKFGVFINDTVRFVLYIINAVACCDILSMYIVQAGS